MHEGILYIFEEGEEKSVTTLAVSSTNFFPGFTLVSILASPEEDEENPEQLAEPS